MDKRLIIGVGATVAAAAGAWAAIYYATYAVRSQLLGETAWRGDINSNAVALTFDDGPSDDTPAILDLLGEKNLKATFFMIGRSVERHPRVARRVAEEGHEIGNHSYSHPVYLFRSAAETARQLERAQEVIEAATGVRPRFARPPCGVRTRAYFRAARRLGLLTVQWDAAGFDWKRIAATEIAVRVLKETRAGSIILLHDGDSEGKADRRRTVESLPQIISGLEARGLRVAPLAEVMGRASARRPEQGMTTSCVSADQGLARTEAPRTTPAEMEVKA
jgi:peptidoglycan/xylan/chitin deacetylase (PgdA/CDA1 family)